MALIAILGYAHVREGSVRRCEMRKLIPLLGLLLTLPAVAQTWSEHCSHKTLAGRIENPKILHVLHRFQAELGVGILPRGVKLRLYPRCI
jgi:hypothetical protein